MSIHQHVPRVVQGMGVAAITLSVGLTACGGSASTTNSAAAKPADCSWAQSPTAAATNATVTSQYDQAPPSCITKNTASNYSATIHTKKGDIVVALDNKDAPATVNNFIFLATHHFYDNILFHRVVPNFVIQAGDPATAVPGADPATFGAGGPGYTIPDEFPQTTNVYKAGSIAMANRGPGTTGSQFFICIVDDSKKLAPNYSYFGQTTAGLDIITKITQGDAIIGIDIAKS